MKFNAEDFFDGKALTLAVAIQRDQLEQARILMTSVDISKLYRQNMTFIMWAIINQRKRSLELLLQAKANPNYQDTDGLSPVAYAATIIDPDYLRLLLRYGGDPNSRDDQQPAIIGAALVDEDLWANVVYLLDHGADINAIDEDGDSLITTYAGLNFFDKVAYLIDRGADVQYVDKYGGTLAYMVEKAKPNPGTENHKWQQIVRKKLIDKGVRFPAPKPWGVQGKNE